MSLAHQHPHPHAHHGHAGTDEHPYAGAAHRHRELRPRVSPRELLALGISGGIVPCPAALVVLLAAVAMQRIGFGLFLIVAFSAGLAAVLIALGIVVVYARRLLARFRMDNRIVTRWLPMASAGVVFLFGMALAFKALRGAGIA